MPRIDFPAEAKHCPICRAKMTIGKTRTRTVVTLAHGVFEAREVLKRCSRGHGAWMASSQALSRLVRTRQRYGYDLIVHVGLARYVGGHQREEIRAELREQYAIELSTGSVSHLCDRFLHLLEALHRAQAPALRRAMHGGYPLHLDATCEHGRGGLCVCLDGWRGWVLLARRIPTENQAYLRPLVEDTVALFGEPIAVMRDLNDAGAAAVEPLRARGVPDLVCHYHFLRAVGNALLDKPYAMLRKVLRATAVRRQLQEALCELRHYRRCPAHEGRFGIGRVREDLLAFVLWLLEGRGHKDLAFPFALPHCDFVERCHSGVEDVEHWVPLPRTVPERRALRHVLGLLGRVPPPVPAARVGATPASRRRAARRCSHAAPSAARRRHAKRGRVARSRWRCVARLAHARVGRARVSARGAQARSAATAPALEAVRLGEIEAAFDDYRSELHRRLEAQGPSTNPTDPSPQAIIAKYLRRYGEHLFGHPARYAEDGTMLGVVERTNNVLEHLFGRSKRQLRRRLGRAHLGRDLEHQPPQAVLAANLTDPTYVRVLCGSVEHLSVAFAELEAESLTRPAPLRDNGHARLTRRVRIILQNLERTGTSADEPDLETGASCAGPATVS